MERTFYGNPAYDWMLAFAIAISLTLALYFVKRYLVRRLTPVVGKTAMRIDDFVLDLIAHTRFLFLLVISIYLGMQYLELPARLARQIENAAIIALLIQVALWGNRGIAQWLAGYVERQKDRAGAASATTVAILGFISRLVLWSVLMLMILENLGFNISALVASLGIGGVAVALAVQNILGDIFSSLSIAMDKPFEIGDFIIVDDHLGTVEYIGLKTTRIRSLSGEQIVFSNSDLLKSRIHNYKRMYERRVLFGFGVTYQTPLAKLERIPEMVRDIVTAQAKTRLDRVHFKEYGDSSLNYEVVYFVLDPDYNRYMDIQQAINLGIFRRFEQERIEFAYPTRTVYVQGEPR